MFFVDIFWNFKHNCVRNVSRRSIHRNNTPRNAFKGSSYVKVTISSPFGDTDIIVLLLAFLQDHKEHILIVDGHGEGKN